MFSSYLCCSKFFNWWYSSF